MAVVSVQNGMHSSPKFHFMRDDVGDDVSSGAKRSRLEMRSVFCQDNQP
jgi:hypothetical protein